MIGLVLLAGGAVMLAIAYQQSDSLGDQTKHLFTGEYRDKTSWMTLIGAIAAALGLIGVVAPGRRGQA